MITISIMAHPLRIEQAVRLADHVEADGIAWDECGDEWDTGARAWAKGSPLSDWTSDWHLVLQDDALPVPGLRDQLDRAVKHCPRTAVSLYVGTGRPRQAAIRRAIARADAEHAAWLEYPWLLWGVAVMLPVEYIHTMIGWANMQPRERAYDQRLSWYFRTVLQRPVRYTWPSLVDHADGPTLIAHSQPPVERRAHRVGLPRRWDTDAVFI